MFGGRQLGFSVNAAAKSRVDEQMMRQRGKECAEFTCGDFAAQGVLAEGERASLVKSIGSLRLRQGFRSLPTSNVSSTGFARQQIRSEIPLN